MHQKQVFHEKQQFLNYLLFKIEEIYSDKHLHTSSYNHVYTSK